MPLTNPDPKSPARIFLRDIEGLNEQLLRADEAGDFEAVEAMLDLLRKQLDALTPWKKARICMECGLAMTPLTTRLVGDTALVGAHLDLCAQCEAASRE
jgi:hypothetical protein